MMHRERSQNSGRKLIEVAEAMLKSHQLLSPPPQW
jgi:hypothetical protein